MLEDLKYVKFVEKEVDDLKIEMDDLKSQHENAKTDFLKVDDCLLQEFFSKDFVCVILLSLDDIDEYRDMACKNLEKIEECERLENELPKIVYENSWVKQSFTSRNNEKVLKAKNDSLIVELNRKTIEINDLKAQLQDKTIVNAKMRVLLNKAKGKYVETKFEKPSVVRQSNAFRFQKSSVLGKPSPFANFIERQFIPKSRFVPTTHEKKDLSKPVTP
ncbi:hypothetical protein Tco_0744908 [Tanacetum coccineum]